MSAAVETVVSIYSEMDVYKALVKHNGPYKVLGGGSNVLIVNDIKEVVLLNAIKGIEVIDEDESSALVGFGAGENWHQCVMWSISHGLGGLENLSLIPGNVGAAPMQNIGAYGVEQEACFHSLRAIHLEEGTSKVFYKDDCDFGYRESVFKRELKGQYIITQVNYLFKKTGHEVNTSYGAIREVLAERGVEDPSIKDVSDAIISIRNTKLPNPAQLPNAGSFFKNPVIGREQFEELQEKHPAIKYYEVDDKYVKIPAAWLIDTCGYKGVRNNYAGVHENHALVLVNHEGKAMGRDILALSDEISEKVQSSYGIRLEREVNVW